MISRVAPALSLAFFSLLLSCEPGTETPDPVLVIEKTPSASGDNQSWGTGHNMPFPLRVVVTTQGGTPVEGVEVTWAVEPGNGFIAALIPITGADGISTARWGMGTVVGTVHATATAEGISGSPVTFTATAIPNLPDEVTIASGDGQTEAVNTQLSDPFVVFVGDQFDNPFPGQSIEWVITSGSGTLSSTISVSDGFGMASTFLTLSSTPGVVTVLARFPGAASGPRVTFTATGTP